MVADALGSAPGAAGAQPLALSSADIGAWLPNDVARGADDGVLYIVDRGTDEVIEVEVPPAAGSAELGRYDLTGAGQVGVNSLRHVVPVVRNAATDPAGTSPRLFLYVTDDSGNLRLQAYDSGTNTVRRLIDDPTFQNAWGLVYIPADGTIGGDCLVVAEQNEMRSYIDIDNPTATFEATVAEGFGQLRGLTLDDSDPDPANWSILAVDENRQMVVRIGRDPARSCF